MSSFSRFFTVSLLFAAAIVAGSGAGCRRAPSRVARPRVDRDVILITIDTLRYDAVGFDGNGRGTTPNLDALAAGGRVFRDTHAQNVLTLPSHTNILTGLYPYEHGVRENSGFRLNPKFPTVATILKAKGYATGAFVAAFPLDARYGLNRGFDVYRQVYQQVDQPSDFRIHESRADAVVAGALEWFKAALGKKRFLWIHLYDPHAPYDPPDPFKQRFADDPYLGEVAFADACLAPLLAAARVSTPSALVIVTADHGEARGDHGELTHGLFAYEATLRVPLFIWCPGLVDPGVDEEMARHVDLLPTILDAIGASSADSPSTSASTSTSTSSAPRLPAPGVSLLAERPSTLSMSRTSYFESLSATLNRGWAPLRGLIGERHKYIDLPIPELYDLAHDPAEAHNLISTTPASAPDVLRRLRRDFDKIPAGSAERSAVGAEEASRLRSLGYLTGSESGKARYGPEDDPKSRIGVDRQLHDIVDAFEIGHLSDAIRIARAVVAANPAMKMGYQQLAFLLQEQGHLGEAVQVLEQASSKGAGGESMDRRRALLLSELGRPQEAAALLRPYAESDDCETLNAFGIALADGGDPAAGLRVFARALELDPGNALAYQNSGIALLKLGRAAQARESLEKALAVNERNPRALNALGVAWMQLDSPDRALDAWTRCVGYDATQYDALYNLGLVAARMGRRDQAIDALRRFAETAPPARYGRDISEVRGALARLTGAGPHPR